MGTDSIEVARASQDYPPSESTRDIELNTLHVGPPLEDPTSEAPENAFSAEGPTPLTRGIQIKLLSAGFSFFFAGTNDGSLGPLVPYTIITYNISTTFVAVMYAQLAFSFLEPLSLLLSIDCMQLCSVLRWLVHLCHHKQPPSPLPRYRCNPGPRRWSAAPSTCTPSLGTPLSPFCCFVFHRLSRHCISRLSLKYVRKHSQGRTQMAGLHPCHVCTRALDITIRGDGCCVKYAKLEIVLFVSDRVRDCEYNLCGGGIQGFSARLAPAGGGVCRSSRNKKKQGGDE